MNRRLRYNEGIWQYLGVLTHEGCIEGKSFGVRTGKIRKQEAE